MGIDSAGGSRHNDSNVIRSHHPPMSTHPLAGKPAPRDLLIKVSRLEAAFYEAKPDLADPNQLVSFGTSGHRGSSSNATFTEAHILAITQAICEYRRNQGITGPLFMGKDTHALSRPAERVALEVLAGNGVEAFIQRNDGFTPTPVISRAILIHNRGRADSLADGIVITPSHNPPTDGQAIRPSRSAKHTTELQSHSELVCRLLRLDKQLAIVGNRPQQNS